VIALQKLEFDDDKGNIICDLIYVAPVLISSIHDHMDSIDSSLIFQSLKDLDEFVDQYVLMLPLMENDENNTMINMFYTVGSKWTERIREKEGTIGSSDFIPMWLSEELFSIWLK